MAKSKSIEEGIPITPKLISWARQRSGITLEEAREKFTNIERWEDGSARPTYPQLENLANTFKVPIAVFFFPDPPKTPPIRESFRTLPDAEFNQLPPQIGYLLRKAKSFQINLAELTQRRSTDRLIIKDIDFNQRIPVTALAKRVRDFIGIDLDQQFNWKDDDSAFKMWRKALFDVGIFVFKDAFHIEDFSGFCLYDEMFPVIYVNNSSTKTRQIFTLFHELAHLLFHTSGIDTLENPYIDRLPSHDKEVEVRCNQFAAEFLVPDSVFSQLLEEFDSSERSAVILASRFHVSREFIYRKFLDRGLIKRSDYESSARRWASQKQSEGTGGNPYWTKIAYLGREYISLALRQYHQNRIDEYKLGEYLHTKPKHLETLEEYFSKGAQ